MRTFVNVYFLHFNISINIPILKMLEFVKLVVLTIITSIKRLKGLLK